MDPSPSKIGFVDLPAEMRNEIYDLTVNEIFADGATVHWADAIVQQPALLNTCRQVRSELLQVYYSRLSLVVEVPSRPIATFRTLIQGADQLIISRITKLSILFPCGTHESNEFFRKPTHFAMIELFKIRAGGFATDISHGTQQDETSPTAVTRADACNDSDRASGKPTLRSPIKRFDLEPYHICFSRNDLKVLFLLLDYEIRPWREASFQKAGVLQVCDLVLTKRVQQRQQAEDGLSLGEQQTVLRKDGA